MFTENHSRLMSLCTYSINSALNAVCIGLSLHRKTFAYEYFILRRQRLGYQMFCTKPPEYNNYISLYLNSKSLFVFMYYVGNNIE